MRMILCWNIYIWPCGACVRPWYVYVVWLYNSILLLISDSIYQKANKISMNRNSLCSNTDVVDGRPHLYKIIHITHTHTHSMFRIHWLNTEIRIKWNLENLNWFILWTENWERKIFVNIHIMYNFNKLVPKLAIQFLFPFPLHSRPPPFPIQRSQIMWKSHPIRHCAFVMLLIFAFLPLHARLRYIDGTQTHIGYLS